MVHYTHAYLHHCCQSLVFDVICEFMNNFLTFSTCLTFRFYVKCQFFHLDWLLPNTATLVSCRWTWGCLLGCGMSLGYTAVSFWKRLDECMPKHWYSRLRCDFKGFKGDDYFCEPNAKVNLINLAGTVRTPAPTKKERKIKQCIARTNWTLEKSE